MLPGIGRDADGIGMEEVAGKEDAEFRNMDDDVAVRVGPAEIVEAQFESARLKDQFVGESFRRRRGNETLLLVIHHQAVDAVRFGQGKGFGAIGRERLQLLLPLPDPA